MSDKEFKNPFNPEEVERLVKEEMVSALLSESITLKALSRQLPLEALCEHKDNERSALITCGVCENKFIVNYKLYIDEYKEWYCKQCGQRLVVNKATTGEAHPKK